MKHTLEPNILCDGAKHGDCDGLVTLTAEDAPTIDSMIHEARHRGWRVMLMPDGLEPLKFYCPNCADETR